MDRHEKNAGKMRDTYLRAYAAVLECSEQDILGPPRFRSLFGYTQSPGGLGPPVDEPLMARILVFIEDAAAEVGKLSAEKKATLVTVIYASAIRDAAEAGIPPTQLDLSRYTGLVRLAA